MERDLNGSSSSSSHKKKRKKDSKDASPPPSASKKPMMASGSSSSKAPKLLHRIIDYLERNKEQTHIDTEAMTKSLHNKYPEYNRIKYKVFTSQVQVAFERAVQRLMEEAGQPEAGDDKDEEEEKNNKKKEKEKAEKARIEKENKANGKSMTNTMNELYKKKDQKEVVEIKMKKDPIMIIDTKGDEKLARERDEKLARQNKKEDPKSSKPVTAAALAKPVEIDLTGRGSSAAKILSEKAIIKSTPLRSDSTKSSRAPSPTMERTPMKRASAKGMIPVVVPKTTFADVGGCEAKLREIHRLTRHLRWPNFYREVGVLPPRGCLLHGPPGCGKTLLANAIAGERSLPILTMAATEFVSGVTGDSERKIRDLFDQAKGAAPCILFIDDVDVIAKRRADAQKDMEMRMVSQLISCLDELNAIGFESEGRVFVIGATSRLESIDPALRTGRRMGREIALGIPDVKARTHILEVLCRDTALAPGLDLQHLARLTPGYVGSDLDSLIAEAASLVDDKMCKEAAKASGGGENSREDDVILWLQESPGAREKLPKAEISLADFEVAIKTVRPSSLTEGFATVPNVSFDDIGALDDIREELELAVCAPVNFPEMVQSLGLDTPSGVLLCGPPGCGKTLLAKAVANQAGINFISVKGPEIMNKYVGESERAVRTIFQRARNSAPCVIFFDEIDAICPRRSTSDSGSGSNRVVNQLLTEMDGVEGRKGVYVMGASNRVEIIDPAILRPGRLTNHFFVDLPAPEGRVDILRKLTKNGTTPPLAADIDLEAIGKSDECDGFSGADLGHLVQRATHHRLKECLRQRKRNPATRINAKVSMRHFNLAFQEVKPAVGEKERKRYESMRMRYTTAKAVLDRSEEVEEEDMDDEEEEVPQEKLDKAAKTVEASSRKIAERGTEAEKEKPVVAQAEAKVQNGVSEKTKDVGGENDKVLTTSENDSNGAPPTADSGKQEEQTASKLAEKVTHPRDASPASPTKEVTKSNVATLSVQPLQDSETVGNASDNDEAPTFEAADSTVDQVPAKKPRRPSTSDLMLASETNPLRLLPDMAVRIKETAMSDCAGCEGRLEQLDGPDAAVVAFQGGGDTTVSPLDLEPFTPEEGDMAKLLVSGERTDVAKVVEIDEDVEEATVWFDSDGAELRIPIDRLCKVITA